MAVLPLIGMSNYYEITASGMMSASIIL